MLSVPENNTGYACSRNGVTALTDNTEEKNSTHALSQTEKEHRTYLLVCEKCREYEKKRLRYRKYGTIFIIISAFVFLALMFSLESKVTFLILWIVTIVFCVVLMLRTDYLYNMYLEMLECDTDEESAQTAPHQNGEVDLRKETQ